MIVIRLLLTLTIC